MLLSLGSMGEEVKEVQRKLNVMPIDGIFGAKTYEALVKFQSENGLRVDGIVGPLTASKLGIFPGMLTILKDANKKFWDRMKS